MIGLLRIAVPLSFGLRHVAPLLAELATRHPKLRIDAAYAERAVDLIAEGFDAAVRLGRLKDSSLIARRIAPIRRAVVASPGYLARHGCPETPGDLARHEFLMRPDQSNSAVWQFRAGQRLISVRPEGRFKADNGEAILQAAIAGLGIAACPPSWFRPAIESGALVPLLPNYPLTEAGLFLVRPPGSPVPGKVRALTDLLLERRRRTLLGRLPDDGRDGRPSGVSLRRATRHHGRPEGPFAHRIRHSEFARPPLWL